MEIYAHRGWSRGPDENSLKFFEHAAACPHLHGVELDIRRDADGRLVVIHDPITPQDNPPTLNEVLELLAPTSTGLMVEIKEPDLSREAIDALNTFKVADRACVFGFSQLAKTLPWDEPRSVELGLIAHLPWQARRLTQHYKPDILMGGFDLRAWTYYGVKISWAMFNMRKIADEANARLVGGIVCNQHQMGWALTQNLDAVTVDLDTARMDKAFLDDGTSLAKFAKPS